MGANVTTPLCLVRWRDAAAACRYSDIDRDHPTPVCETVGRVERIGEALVITHGHYRDYDKDNGPVTVIPLGWAVEIVTLVEQGRVDPLDL